MEGDPVNLAARLMQSSAKKGTTSILCCENTFQASKSRLSFSALPPLKLKGKANEVNVYAPTNNQIYLSTTGNVTGGGGAGGISGLTTNMASGVSSGGGGGGEEREGGGFSDLGKSC